MPMRNVSYRKHVLLLAKIIAPRASPAPQPAQRAYGRGAFSVVSPPHMRLLSPSAPAVVAAYAAARRSAAARAISKRGGHPFSRRALRGSGWRLLTFFLGQGQGKRAARDLAPKKAVRPSYFSPRWCSCAQKAPRMIVGLLGFSACGGPVPAPRQVSRAVRSLARLLFQPRAFAVFFAARKECASKVSLFFAVAARSLAQSCAGRMPPCVAPPPPSRCSRRAGRRASRRCNGACAAAGASINRRAKRR